MHMITTDRTTGIIQIEVVGLWTSEHVEVFAEDMHREARSLGMRGKRHLMLIDYSRASIQPQAVIAALRELTQTSPLKARKCALYTNGVLGRLQAKRIATARGDIGVFSDRDAALAWLRDDGATTPPPIDAIFPPYERQRV